MVTGLARTVSFGCILSFLSTSGCLVREVCFGDTDCAGGLVCDPAVGQCVRECTTDADCGFGFTCEEYGCVFRCEGGDMLCPDDMVSICGVFCIDVFEASRPDASESSSGTEETLAVSQGGVIPWHSSDPTWMNQAVAREACQAAGKRLCTAYEWETVCRGMDELAYCYGDTYHTQICNGIDTYCPCGTYPYCYEDCGADFHVMPTGSFEDCTNSFGIYDINGNVWEVVASDDGLDHYRGGAYNCADSERLHDCEYDAVWNPSAKGFRCCADGQSAG